MTGPRRIVALAPNWLGDAVMALPALAGIRAAHPAATLIVAARPGIAPLFTMVPGVDQTLPLQAGGGWRGALMWKRDAEALRSVGADAAILFPNSFRSAWTVRQAGVPERWGFSADLRNRLLTRVVPRLRGRRHMTEYYGALVAGLDMPAAAQPAEVRVPDAARTRAADLLRTRGVNLTGPVVGMAPGAAYGRAKQWPPERFAQLAVELRRRLGAVCIIVGAGGDAGTGRTIRETVDRLTGSAAATGDVLVDLVGATDLVTLAGVMSCCQAFVSNDSGAMHLAAAVGRPVTAPFGSTDEVGTAPMSSPMPGTPGHEILATDVWCRPCMLRECPIDHRCMTRISVDRMADAVARQLRATGRT
jgi:heptosyltransferase-2